MNIVHFQNVLKTNNAMFILYKVTIKTIIAIEWSGMALKNVYIIKVIEEKEILIASIIKYNMRNDK